MSFEAKDLVGEGHGFAAAAEEAGIYYEEAIALVFFRWAFCHSGMQRT